ncbi:MAG: Zn-ribbon domain-containing OB-fold protein [Desulfobacterales bacterium]|nr:Zn-ribbon domain-containing OB-fold protein [Desulfobacterales bacterium]
MGKKEKDIRFGKFGTVSFTETTRVNDFIDNLEQGKVMHTCCKACGEHFFPPRADCSKCLASDMEWQEVKGKGSLVSYSRLKYAPAGFEEDLPYTIALLDYGRYQVFGRLDGRLDPDEVKIGMDLSTVVNELPDGRLNYVFKKV